MRETLSSGWGPLSEPIHTDAPAPGRPAFRDNAYLGFWNRTGGLCGAFHVSTSPNAEGRRARFSLSIGGRPVEIVEPLEPYSFKSASIAFDLDRLITVDGGTLAGELALTPLYAVADYSKGAIIPGLVADEPLAHFQQAARVEGHLRVEGRDVTVDGYGIRDRTWGYRDESASIAEYVAVTGVFDGFALTAMRFVGADGTDRTEGYQLTGVAEPVASLGVTRDPSGLLCAAHLQLAGGSPLELVVTERLGGLWVPMGWERRGPTMSAYDEFNRVRTGSEATGVSLTEQGVVRRIF